MKAEPMGITLYSDAAYYGGAEVYLTTLARHLDPERFRLSALVPEDPPVRRLEEELEAAGARLARHRRPGFRWWEALPRLRRDLSAIGGEVLHINLPSTYDAGLSSVALAGRMAGYRRVLTTEHLPMIERRYRKFPGKILFSEAVDLVLVPARATREFVVRLHHLPWEKTRVIPYGIEEPPPPSPEVEEEIRARTDTPPGTLTLGIVGRLTPRKGHRFLFEALTILRSSEAGRRGMRLWVIGEGEDRDALAQEVRERGLDTVVRFVGARQDAASLIRLLDLLVVPSLVETTPFVILEAMACSRSVVASRIYGIPEMIEHGASGFLVTPGEPEELARALEPLIADPEMRARFGRRSRELYEATFSAERMARATEASYVDSAPGRSG